KKRSTKATPAPLEPRETATAGSADDCRTFRATRARRGARRSPPARRGTPNAAPRAEVGRDHWRGARLNPNPSIAARQRDAARCYRYSHIPLSISGRYLTAGRRRTRSHAPLYAGKSLLCLPMALDYGGSDEPAARGEGARWRVFGASLPCWGQALDHPANGRQRRSSARHPPPPARPGPATLRRDGRVDPGRVDRAGARHELVTRGNAWRRPTSIWPSRTRRKPMDLSLQGKVALVTGAARGIGRAIALELAQAGARVAVADIRLGKYEGERYYRISRRVSGDDEDVPTVAAIEGAGGQAIGIELDVSNAAQ